MTTVYCLMLDRQLSDSFDEGQFIGVYATLERAMNSAGVLEDASPQGWSERTKKCEEDPRVWTNEAWLIIEEQVK